MPRKALAIVTARRPSGFSDASTTSHLRLLPGFSGTNVYIDSALFVSLNIYYLLLSQKTSDEGNHQLFASTLGLAVTIALISAGVTGSTGK